MNRSLIFACLFLSLLFYSCSVKKYIPEDEYLYTGANMEFDVPPEVKDFKKIRPEIESLARPRPNSKVFGMYLGLWAHYKGSKERPGFINRFLKNRIGEEPVYLSDVNPARTEELIVNRLENRGFFYSESDSETIRKNRFAEVNYEVKIVPPYTLAEYGYEEDSITIDREIRELLADTELKEGVRFDLDLLKSERERLDRELKQRGFYNFNSDFLIFEADTNINEERKFNLFLRLKQNVPDKSVLPYRVENIYVFPDYSLDHKQESGDTVSVNGIDFIQEKTVFKPHLLEQYILLETGHKYNSGTSRLTSNRLSSIGNYRYVNLRFQEKDTVDNGGEGILDARIYLSPLNKRAVRAELQGLSKSNNFAGPAFLLSYRNRNLFQGGETLNITAKFAWETQLTSGERAGLNSYELGLKGDLIFPRVVFPIPINERFSYSVPKTKISLGTEYQDRVLLYRLNSIYATYGYFWNANRFVYHEINPISLNFVSLFNVSDEFDAILESNPFLRRSFEQQFIAGVNYNFSYNQLMDQYRTHSIFVGTTLDFAGQGIQLFNSIVNSDSPSTFLGMEYAQYAKGDVDFRYYLNLSNDHKIVTRLFGGLGLPYGNSVSLPFIKQYFSGGPNSVRAFRIRSLGPGSFRPESFDTRSFFDQAGDIRIEGNVEYRFPLVSFLKGAIFADAGNVWLINENEALPGGRFSRNWLKELGVGVGFGMRVDLDFFVIRLDLASPVHKPYLQEGERWDYQFDIGSKSWRRENLLFNFAIGYPF